MKKNLLSLAAIIVIALFSNGAMAQNTATDASAAYATIIAPITIDNTIDLNFGDVIAGAGYVTLSTAGVRGSDYQAFSGLQVGTISAASFNITGEKDYTYSITLPTRNGSNPIVLSDGGTATLNVDTFVSKSATLTVDSLTGKLDASNKDTVLVGATLRVATGQTAGLYTGTFNVTVAYN